MELITVQIDVDVKKTVDVEIYPSDILRALNTLSNKEKWNAISIFLKDLDTDLKDLTDNQKDRCKAFLEQKLELFSNPNGEEKSPLN